MNPKSRRPKATSVYSDDQHDVRPSVNTRDIGTYYDANSRATPEGEAPDRRQAFPQKRTEFDLPADRYSDHGYDDDDDDDDARTVTLGKGKKSSSLRSDDDELDEDGDVESSNIEDDIKYK